MPKAGKRIATTKLSTNRTTTVPEPVRTAEGLDIGDEVEWRLIDGEWVLKPIPEPTTVSATVFDDLRGEPCSECETGTLEAVECDGTTKLVCTDCETTRAELWGDN